MEQSSILRTGNAEETRRLGIERIVLAKIPGCPLPAWTKDAVRWRVLLENRLYQVGELLDESG